MSATSSTVIGIDLGTTNCRVAVFQHGKVQIIPNELGNLSTPNYVAFTDVERLVGDAAKNQAVMNPSYTVFDVMRLMGRRCTDPETLAKNQWPFDVVTDGSYARIRVEYKGQEKVFCPEQIISMVLGRLKENAEAYLQTSVTDAVVAVPACFGDFQRQTIKDACIIAGLNVLRLISAPTAAAVAYGFKNNIKNEQNVLVFDLGGGTFDVSIVSIDKLYEVMSTAGDAHLGGEDFNQRMVNYFIQEFQRKYKKDISQHKRAVLRLRTACEKAKRTLSATTEARIEIDALYESKDFYTKITRSDFEDLNSDLFISTLEPVTKALSDAKFDKSEINEIVLVGGSTRIPKVQKLLQEFFNREELSKSINPDEAIVYGAALQAGLLCKGETTGLRGFLLLDVIPFSLGIETTGGVMTPLIRRNSTIPSKKTLEVTTSEDNEAALSIQVYEGERAMVEDNNLLGTFVLAGIHPAPRGEPQIEVTFDIDHNGILVVAAANKRAGIENKLTITDYKGKLSSEEVQRMTQEAAQYKKEDEDHRAMVAAKNSLESYVFELKSALKSTSSELIAKCEATIDWLDEDASTEKEEFAAKRQELETACRSMVDQLLALK